MALKSRSHELAVPELPSAKRQKLAHNTTTDSVDVKSLFDPNVIDTQNIQEQHSAYEESTPYKHAVIPRLFQEDLLVGVKDECITQLNFTQKETDIYKVNQTGDLASLSYLTAKQLALLPNLLKLRDALYSPEFTSLLRSVTGCGPLSVSKRDMSVNSYTKGCHLLNHDDVIGSRRVSYILYMPLPHSSGTLGEWKSEWGGSLELYPTDENEQPMSVPSKSVPPSWNQFIFFEVQPGKSFHSVEEVTVGGDDDERARLSISGWFHAAQEGEEGYEAEAAAPTTKSSLEQLTNTSTAFSPFPEDVRPAVLDDEPVLTAEHTSFLSEYLNPVYLQVRSMKVLSARFIEESSLELHDFLAEPLAEKLDGGLRALDADDGLGPQRNCQIPPHSAGTDGSWLMLGPPHRQRYCVLKTASTEVPDTTVGVHTSDLSVHSAHADTIAILRRIQDELLPSEAFRAWIVAVSKLIPLGHHVEARRFRPGLDYTLATSEESEARLDVVIGLTPQTMASGETKAAVKSNGKGKAKQTDTGDGGNVEGWPSGSWGGWECYMAPHEGDDDPAVYRSTTSKAPQKAAKEASDEESHEDDEEDKPMLNDPSVHDITVSKAANGAASDGESDDDDDGDGTLLTVLPGFNRLLLVLRDEKVMRFVKYVSAAAQGSRWDVCGEYEVGMIEEDDESSE